MGKLSRSKGHRGEREVLELFKKFYPEARKMRRYQYETDNGCDLENTGMFSVQVKLGSFVPKKFDEWLAEIKKQDTYNVLFSRKDRSKWNVTMSSEDFFEILDIIKTNGIKI